MKQLLWLKFYPKDWNGDHNLRACSLAARGLLASFLEPMHTAEPYGHLLLRGKKPEYDELAVVASCKEREVKYGLEELLKTGVLSVTEDGIYYSRRMVRDAERSKKKQKDGKNGGNPQLLSQTPIQSIQHVTGGEVNHEVNHLVKPIESRVQSLEARDQSTAPSAPRTPAPSTTRIPAIGHGFHAKHACCGKMCLPEALYLEFAKRVSHLSDPTKYVGDWFVLVNTRYTVGDRKDEIVGEDMFDFWRKRWLESHPAVAAKPAVDIVEMARKRIEANDARYGKR